MAKGSVSFNFGANRKDRKKKPKATGAKKKSGGKGRSDAWRQYTGQR